MLYEVITYKAAARGTDGRLYFGGINGMNAFYPDKVLDNPYIPPCSLPLHKRFYWRKINKCAFPIPSDRNKMNMTIITPYA